MWRAVSVAGLVCSMMGGCKADPEAVQREGQVFRGRHVENNLALEVTLVFPPEHGEKPHRGRLEVRAENLGEGSVTVVVNPHCMVTLNSFEDPRRKVLAWSSDELALSRGLECQLAARLIPVDAGTIAMLEDTLFDVPSSRRHLSASFEYQIERGPSDSTPRRRLSIPMFAEDPT